MKTEFRDSDRATTTKKCPFHSITFITVILVQQTHVDAYASKGRYLHSVATTIYNIYSRIPKHEIHNLQKYVCTQHAHTFNGLVVAVAVAVAVYFSTEEVITNVQ